MSLLMGSSHRPFGKGDLHLPSCRGCTGQGGYLTPPPSSWGFTVWHLGNMTLCCLASIFMVLTAEYLNCLPQGMISDCSSDKPCFKLRFALTLALSPLGAPRCWCHQPQGSTGPVTDQKQAFAGMLVVSVSVTGLRGGRQEPGVQAHSPIVAAVLKSSFVQEKMP